MDHAFTAGLTNKYSAVPQQHGRSCDSTVEACMPSLNWKFLQQLLTMSSESDSLEDDVSLKVCKDREKNGFPGTVLVQVHARYTI